MQSNHLCHLGSSPPRVHLRQALHLSSLGGCWQDLGLGECWTEPSPPCQVGLSQRGSQHEPCFTSVRKWEPKQEDTCPGSVTAAQKGTPPLQGRGSHWV